MGVLLATVYKYKSNYTKEFVITLSLMPALIAVIIALVNGNLGAGVAVAGTFSLIKFRSARFFKGNACCPLSDGYRSSDRNGFPRFGCLYDGHPICLYLDF